MLVQDEELPGAIDLTIKLTRSPHGEVSDALLRLNLVRAAPLAGLAVVLRREAGTALLKRWPMLGHPPGERVKQFWGTPPDRVPGLGPSGA